MKPNHLFRRVSLLTFGTCVIAGSALGDPLDGSGGIYLTPEGSSLLRPFETSVTNVRDNIELSSYNGGVLLYSDVDPSAPSNLDGGITLMGTPVSIVLSSSSANPDAVTFDIWRASDWGSTTVPPLFRVNGTTRNTTFTDSDVAINDGNLSVGGVLSVIGNQNVTGALNVAGSPVLTSASAGSVLTGQNFVQLESSGVLNIASTSTSAVSVSGGIAAIKDAKINSITVGRGPGGALTNTVFGRNAFEANSGGLGNTAVGNFAMKSATLAYYNTALGSNALQSTVSGGSNVAVGNSALFSNTSSGNVGTGYNTLTFKTSGASNVAVGHRAGEQQSDNSNLVTSSDSIFIGAGTKGSTAGSINSIVIGTNTVSDGPNTTVIGNTSTLSTRLEGETKSESLRVSGNTVLEGDTVLEGNVTLATAQGDISMGDYQ